VLSCSWAVEPLYLLLLLRDRGSQVLNFQIKHGLLSGIGNGLGWTPEDLRDFRGQRGALCPTFHRDRRSTTREIPFRVVKFAP